MQNWYNCIAKFFFFLKKRKRKQFSVGLLLIWNKTCVFRISITTLGSYFEKLLLSSFSYFHIYWTLFTFIKWRIVKNSGNSITKCFRIPVRHKIKIRFRFYCGLAFLVVCCIIPCDPYSYNSFLLFRFTLPTRYMLTLQFNNLTFAVCI